jgi:Tol biopolymer transport system component
MYQRFLCIILIAAICSCTRDKNPLKFKDYDYHDKILFTSRRSGNEQLFVMSPNGNNIIQITGGKFWHNNGKWSPDAQRIVCNTEEMSTTAGLEMAVINSDGSNKRVLSWGNQMSWHPDGRKILFSYAPLEIKIFDIKFYSFDLDMKTITVLSEKYAGYHTLSPNGAKIAFTTYADSISRILLLDYPQFNNPTSIGPAGAFQPNYSHSGAEIVFLKRERPGCNDIYIMSSDGTNARRIAFNSAAMPFANPTWSPDVKKLIFLAYTTNGTDNWYLYMINADGTNLHQVIDDNSVTSCDWSK